MSFDRSGEFDDVLEDGMVQGPISIGTTETAIRVGGSNLEGREVVRIYNNSSTIIYLGPSGVTPATGEPLRRRQSAELPLGEAIDLFGIVASGSANAIVWEFA